MPTARTIITRALSRMNKLSPGETLDADVAATCLAELNAIADDWSAGRDKMPQLITVAGAVTGASLTLAAGSFAAVAAGDQPVQLTADNWPMAEITMQQYQNITVKTTSGRPCEWAFDGLATIYLYPAPSGHTISMLVPKNFTAFADLDTNYAMPSGYMGAFAAELACAVAPALLGGVTPTLITWKKEALFNIESGNVRPAIIGADPMRGGMRGTVLTGFN